MTDIEKEYTKRRSHQTSLGALYEDVKKAEKEKWNLKTCEDMAEELDKWMEKLDEIQEKIMELCNNEEELMKLNDAPYTKLLLTYREVRKLLFKCSAFNVPVVSNSSAGPAPPTQVVKLPTLSLPEFSGTGGNWLHFHDLFVTAVHNNATLNGAQKLQYLNSCLKGEAAALIKNLPVSNSTYNQAWEIITNRYHNPKILLDEQLSRLFHLPPIKTTSAPLLRQLVDKVKGISDSLVILQKDIKHIDYILVHVTEQALDMDTSHQWNMAAEEGKERTFEDLLKFISKTADSLAVLGGGATKAQSQGQGQQQPQQPKQNWNTKGATTHHATGKEACLLCKGEHYLYKCSKFLEMTVDKRWAYVRETHLCFNCLVKGHSVQSCRCDRRCWKCKKTHHTLLHEERASSSAPLPSQSSSSSASTDQGQQQRSVVSQHSCGSSAREGSLLATALVRVQAAGGNFRVFRALVDGGSEVSFVSQKCATMLGLRGREVDVEIKGIAACVAGRATREVDLILGSCHNDFSTATEALVVSKVTQWPPRTGVAEHVWPHIDQLTLADPTFYKSSRVDLLLGVKVVADIKREGVRNGPLGTPVAENSALGWLLSGRLPAVITSQVSTIHVNHAEVDINTTMQRFWQLEEVPSTTPMSPDDKECEAHFMANFKRAGGRYQVSLPFKLSNSQLGNSREIAIKRLLSVERRLGRDSNRQQQYIQFMEEYERLGHMEPIPIQEVMTSSTSHCYIPHHEVIKESSTTTKCRVVFDASAKTASGTSLNNLLHTGRVLQDNLVNIIMRFRLHRVAFTADIEKMYRQILVHPEDQDFQRIVWRRSPLDPIRDFRLKTVTYGTGAAPFLATRVLQQIANDEEKNFPEAAKVILRDFYVDDALSGASTTEEATSLAKYMIELLSRGGFKLRKWSSNDPGLLESLPEEWREAQVPLTINSDDQIKALGLQWNPGPDTFTFTVSMAERQDRATKRTLLSDIARLFDPLGWLAPTVIRGKILLQELWRLGLGWDDPIPSVLSDAWNHYRDEMTTIRHVAIPRCVLPPGSSNFQLHGFCDASEQAYGAAVYLRSADNSKAINVFLLAAKTKVAPLNTVSIPRLELCGAKVLSRLMESVLEALPIQFVEVHAWTDSTVVLGWLAPSNKKRETFVANRVTLITEIIPFSQWHHVRSEDNPADCASRGISPGELKDHHLWWTGPSWLKYDSINFIHSTKNGEEEAPEVVIAAHVQSEEENSILHRFSSLNQLLKVTARCKRWARYFKSKVKCQDQIISVAERRHAFLHWVQVAQREAFPAEVAAFNSKKGIPEKSTIRNLAPFYDDKMGVIRVGGRLRNAEINWGRRHPILLPQRHHVTWLLLDELHRSSIHGGAQLMQSLLSREYWIINARHVLQKFVRQCVRCTRLRAETATQMMADLPTARVNPSRAFNRCGVDYAGPLTLRPMIGRGVKFYKGYVAVFVCFVTRAIHLEPVGDLSSVSFLNALRRFIGRRGKCSTIISDCGTNFIGAAKEMKEFVKLILSKDHNDFIAQQLAAEAITWQFNPPSAPHFGGLWESGVKSMKGHFKRFVGDIPMTFEELQTVLCQIEACLNSRPLCPVSSDPTDLEVLTPGHFLIGAPLLAVPEPDLTGLSKNRLSRWQLQQQIVQFFWRRWSSEYLNRLQQRPKWLGPQENMQVGDLVLIKDEGLPPLKWKRGRVTEVHPGKDNLIRSVKVFTSEGELLRPVVKLCQLPIKSSSSSESESNVI